MDGAPPYMLWKEVIKNYLEICTPDQLYRVIRFYPAEVSKLVPQLKLMLGEIPQSMPIGAENERDRLFEAISQVITNISKETPLMIIFDDLQWADRSSLLLLHYIAHGVHRDPLFILNVYRDTDIDENHPLTPVLEELNRERLLHSIFLKRLSLNSVTEIIQQILRQEDVPEEFCKQIYKETQDNPLFANFLFLLHSLSPFSFHFQ